MAKVIYANTHDSNMRYKIPMHIPDAFFYLETKEGNFVYLDHREFGVFQQENKNSH